MIAGLSLLATASVVLALGPRLATTPWTQQAPRLAIMTWQALTVSVVVTVALAGVTMLIPLTALAGGLGGMVHACAESITAAYGSSQFLPVKLVGAVLAGALPIWVVVCAVRVLCSGWRDRRRLHRSLRLVSRDALHGVAVIDSPAAAAFCVPGRNGQIVITRGALDRLSSRELDSVLAHEAAHLRERHIWALALSEVLATAFPGVRLFEVARGETRQLIELMADDAAARQVDRVSVASAIVSLVEMRAPTSALAMAQDAAVLRVSRLLDPRPPLEPWRYRAAAFGASAVILVPLLIAGYPALCAALSDLCNI
ncbi:Zn-dependent protease with chaperone function [Blastococcus aurantiacus]|uniref:Zn-dependent protease with chaperone function n=1 Tax=Blastococcus aurantiacus TaxID=1550231 RepID=A0A1G7R8Y0_9ACTN|nr:M56 family metallopeptidase [Blastococcus aurantiacus]SDG07207.1 Zn-dependent protease with chaperone function [Blastococcus aurantiacus]